jgi:hypothetical protein
MTESKIEDFAIELLKDQGFDYLFGPDIFPASRKTGVRSEAKRRNGLQNCISVEISFAIPEKHTIFSGKIY